MEFYDFVQPPNANESPFDSLSNLCTLLAISNEGLIPLDALSDTVSSALKKEPNSGDVLVMAARTLAIFFDKFSLSLDIFGKKHQPKVRKSVSAAFNILNDFTLLEKLKFAQCTRGELTEELLKCFHLINNLSPEFRSLLPSLDKQIAFCKISFDGSKWTSCKILRHLSFVVRSTNNKSLRLLDEIGEICLKQSANLPNLDIDFEWDELLRTITECVLTLMTWRGKSANRNALSDEAPSNINRMFESYLKVVTRIAESGTAEDRVNLVLSCADAVLDSSIPVRAPLLVDEVLSCLIPLLERSSKLSLSFSNPFEAKNAIANEEHDEDSLVVLPNLQWNVPDYQWSALSLVGKVLGGSPLVQKEFQWAWRGGDDEYVSYNKKERELLTNTFNRRQATVSLKGGKHVISIVNMTDTNLQHKQSTVIHFQPVPVQYMFENKPLEVEDPLLAESVIQKCHYKEALGNVLRTLSFGNSSPAKLAKMVHLHLVRFDQPNNDEATLGAFRSLIASQLDKELELIADSLVKRDASWASILREAGVADAITHCAASSLEIQKIKDANRKRSRGSSPAHVSPTLLAMKKMRRSPIVDIIDQAQPLPTPLSLASDKDDIHIFLRNATVSDFVTFLDSGGSKWPASDVLDALDQVDDSTAYRLQAAVESYILRELQNFSIEGHRHLLLTSLTDDENACFPLTICFPNDPSTGQDGGALQFCCKKGHSLKVHFSSNWKCNICKKRSSYGSLGCRACDLDICTSCVEKVSGTLQVNLSATVGDVLQVWNEKRSTKSKKKHGRSCFLYSQNGVLPNPLPISCVRQRTDLHCGTVTEGCKCGVLFPKFVQNFQMFFDKIYDEEKHKSNLPLDLKIVCTLISKLKTENTICFAIIEAISSFALTIFELGVSGLPARFKQLVTILLPLFSIGFKRDLTHFVAVGCRRFALESIQNGDLQLRGAVKGEAHSNGLSQKISVCREIKENAIHQLYISLSRAYSLRNKIEFVFEGEQGTGSGPTQEFYGEISKYFLTLETMWYKKEYDGVTVVFPTNQAVHEEFFFVLGAILGRAFVDGYFMEITLDPLFWQLTRSPILAERHEDGCLLETAAVLESNAFKVLRQLEPNLISSFEMMLRSTTEELLQLDLTDDDGNILNSANISAFVSRKIESHLRVCSENAFYFSLGFSRFVSPEDLIWLSEEELSPALTGYVEDEADALLFTEEELKDCIMEAHGYPAGAKEVKAFIQIVGSEFSRLEQKYFLEFLTGSSKLPLNGLRGLGRKITVVKKDMEGAGEQTLPSCNTCFLYFKLPPYSSKEMMKKRLLLAITEGRKYFSLS